MSEKKLLLIDGNSIAFKAYFAIPKDFTNRSGMHTNAIYGFHTMLDSLLERIQPTHLLVAFDAGKTTFRTEMFQDYKGGRPSTDPELREQFLPLREMLTARGIEYYELPNYEADDIIGTVARLAEEEGFDQITIVSGDRDLTQLATEKTTVEISRKGVSEIEEYTPTSTFEKLGITPKQIIDLKGLMGDSSDNIPGVTKVGEKTALKLLTEYGTIENLYTHVDELKTSKMKENLIADKEVAFLSKELATINTNSPVEVTLTDLERKPADNEKLIAFYEENNFSEFLYNMGAAGIAEKESIPFTVVEKFSEEMLESANVLHIEFYGENYQDANVVAIAIGNEEKIEVSANLEVFQNEDFRAWLENSGKEKTVFDVKAHLVLLHQFGIALSGVKDDLLLASYILEVLDRGQEVAGVLKKIRVNVLPANEEIYGKGAKQAIPTEEILQPFVVKKVECLIDLKEVLLERLEKNNQMSLYREIEIPTALVLAKMEISGVRVIGGVLNEISMDLVKRLKDLESSIYQKAGVKFNINSPKQLGELLFETLGFDYKLYTKKTKTGYSTSAEVLEKMSVDAPIVDDVLQYRELKKLQSTYIEGLNKAIRKDGKIHTRYNQALTNTGRLSSVDPNLQNIPVRTEDGRNIRKAFVPSEKNWLLYSSDYSQIELRVLADISKDEHLMQAFVEGQDIHTSTAMRVFGIENAEEVTPLDRRHAKAVNFGVVYGTTKWGLAKNLNISPIEAEEFIEKYFEKYPGIKEYMEDVVREAKNDGFVETTYHRRRYLSDINTRNFARRAAGERMAINTPIQGTAADILKIAMIHLSKRLEKETLRCRMLLQVHDELIFEVHKDDVEILDRIVKEEMENAVKLNVPLVADSAWGETWYEAK